MKKLLCLALAFVMLGGTALGEAYLCQVSFSADAQQLATLLEATGLGGNVAMLAQGLEELFDMLRASMLVQHTGTEFGLYLEDTPIIEVASFQDADGLTKMITNLLPEHYFAYQQTEKDIARAAAAEAVMHGTDWPSVGVQVTDTVKAWWDALPSQLATGYFIGDAYTGGASCVTRTLDDGHIAALVDDLSALLQGHGVDDGFLMVYLPQQNLWEAISEANRSAAEANRYAYTVKQVYTADGTLCGMSLVVMDGDSQVMSASLGLEGDSCRLVLGWGLNDTNYYLYADAAPGELGQEWSLMMYQDPQHLGFPTVESMYEYILWMAGGVLDIRQEAGSFRLEMEVIDPQSAVLSDCYVSVKGQNHEDGLTVDGALYLVAEDNVLPESSLLNVNITWRTADERTWSVGEKQPMDFALFDELYAGTDGMLQQELQQAENDMLVTLFKKLPSQLLTFLINPVTE